MAKLRYRYPRGSTSRCVQTRPAELLRGGWGLCRENLVQDAGGVLQAQPEQSLRCMHFHQQSFVVCLRRESIPEGESDRSFIAQRLAINPMPVIFFVTTLKTLPLMSFPCNTEPQLQTSKGLWKALQLPVVFLAVVISEELKTYSVPSCLSCISIQNAFLLPSVL